MTALAVAALLMGLGIFFAAVYGLAKLVHMFETWLSSRG